jgi:hypothetical protein
MDINGYKSIYDQRYPYGRAMGVCPHLAPAKGLKIWLNNLSLTFSRMVSCALFTTAPRLPIYDRWLVNASPRTSLALYHHLMNSQGGYLNRSLGRIFQAFGGFILAYLRLVVRQICQTCRSSLSIDSGTYLAFK